MFVRFGPLLIAADFECANLQGVSLSPVPSTDAEVAIHTAPTLPLHTLSIAHDASTYHAVQHLKHSVLFITPPF